MNRSLVATTLLFAASIVGSIGCDVLFPSGERRSAVLGPGPDGGACTKDEQTIKNVMLAPPTCNATNPCPCGTFCSSQTGGNCVADCVDDSWCSPGFTCSGFGQCVRATDGGAGDGGSSTSADPSCPRDPALLSSLSTMQRPCQFDDMCPQGSFCNQVKGVCDVSCQTDSACASMNSPGHTFVCSCLGKCAEVAAPRVPAAETLPNLEVTPKQFTFNRPSTITTPNWGDTNSRQIGLVVTTPFVTTSTGGSGGAGGAGGSSGGTITGPTATIQVNPGPGLMVQCPASGAGGAGGALSAMPCSVSINPSSFTKVKDTYRSATIYLTVAPSPGAPTADSWSLQLESAQIANVPQTVSLRYAAAVSTPLSPTLTQITTSLDTSAFFGVGQVDLTTPTGEVLHIPVKGRWWNGRFTLFDETRQLSPSGKLVLIVPPNPVDWQTLIDATGDSDVALQDTFQGGVIQRIVNYQIFQDQAGNYSGNFNRVVFTDFVFDKPFSGDPGTTFDPVLPATFTLTKSTAAVVGDCEDDSWCSGGATCDLGFCQFGPKFHTDPSTAAAARAAAYQLLHKRMSSWGNIYYGNVAGGRGHLAIYMPSSSYYNTLHPSSSIGLSVQGPLGAVSGEPTATLMTTDFASSITSQIPRAIPVITQQQYTPQPAPQLLQNCVADLVRDRQRPRPSVVAGPVDFDVWDTNPACINLGRTALALSDKTTFQRTLQEWLTVHSFAMREGLEEHSLGDEACQELSDSVDVNSAPPELTTLLGIGESGLGLLLDINAHHGGTAFQAMAPSEIWTTADFRQSRLSQACVLDSDCNGGGAKQMSCVSSQCQLLSMRELPHHDQPVGIPAFILETAGSYLKVLEAYMKEAARQTYGAPTDNSPTSARQTALARFGMGMRLVLAVEQLAKGIKDKAGACPASSPGWNNANCVAVADRYQAALDEMTTARRRAMQQGEAVLLRSNPLAISEDDTPLFFGDPVGTNSRYFAASDYLLEGWATPAVNEAQASLDAARNACIARMQANVQDELNQHNRQQEIDQLMSKYGSPILAACGNMSVPDGSGGFRLIDSTQVVPYFTDTQRTLDNNSCFYTRECLDQNGDIDGRLSLQKSINAAFMDTPTHLMDAEPGSGSSLATMTVRSQTCKIGASSDTWDEFQYQIAEACPLDAGNKGTSSCSVQTLTDGNLYFASGVAYRIPLAALFGPIRKADLGTFYALASPPGPSTGIFRPTYNRAMGPDYDVYSYQAHAKPRKQVQQNIAAELNNLFKGAQRSLGCASGQGGHPSRDYPLPVPTLPSTCYKGALGVATLEAQGDWFKAQKARQILDNNKLGLTDTFNLCTQIENDANTINALQQGQDDLNKFYKDQSDIAGYLLPPFSYSPPFSFSFSSGSPTGSPTLNLLDHLAGNKIQDEQNAITRMEKQFSAAERAQQCWNTWRAQTRELHTAMTDIQIAANDLDAQQLRIKDMQDGNTLNITEGIAALKRERQSPVKSLSHHFWLDEKVERFRTEFAWAQRLTFIAMRAVEYEFQQSMPYRSEIVGATTATDLEKVIIGLKQEQASRTLNRRRPEESAIVISLRDDVLGIADRSSEPARERNWTPAQRFASRMWTDAYGVRDKDGNYLGQGIPFTLGPTGVLETRCGERLWRATATLQGDGIEASAPGASVILMKKNSFASQYCDGKAPTIVGLDGTSITPTMQAGVIHTSSEMFLPGANVDLSDANDFTAALLYPWFNIRKTDFYKTTYQDGASEELAGRGLYGDYVLLFPKQMLTDDFKLDKVEDVLLRFDYLSVDNLSQ